MKFKTTSMRPSTAIKLIVALCLSFSLTGCRSYHYYTKTFLGSFDTVTTYITYARNAQAFEAQCALVEERLTYYDHLFNAYHSYPGIVNIKVINEKAAVTPQVLDDALYTLIDRCIMYHDTISDKVNIAFGAVTSLWHDCREKAEANGGVGAAPSRPALVAASQHTDLHDIVLDAKKKTIFLKDDQLKLDVGAVAKGYAMQCIKEELMAEGIDSFLLSGGGNVVACGMRKVKQEGLYPLDGCRDHYCVGIASPRDGNYASNTEDMEAVLIADDAAVVTSGDYQRYFNDESGRRYAHIIDPTTLYPPALLRSVSIMTSDSLLADFLSTALFLMRVEEGETLLAGLEDDVEAIWLLTDGHIRYTSGLTLDETLYIVDMKRLE